MQDAQHGHVRDRPQETSGAGTARPCMQATAVALFHHSHEIVERLVSMRRYMSLIRDGLRCCLQSFNGCLILRIKPVGSLARTRENGLDNSGLAKRGEFSWMDC